MFTSKNKAASKVMLTNLVRLPLIGRFKKETLTPTETHGRLRLTEPEEGCQLMVGQYHHFKY